MTITFEDRATPEEAIDSCSTDVRLMQEKIKNNDKNVQREDMAKELKKLVAMRKELQAWEETGVQNGLFLLQSPPIRTLAQKTQHHDGIASKLLTFPNSLVQQTEDAEDELERRAAKVEDHVVETDEKLTTLETQVTQIERTKKALKYLEENETKEKVVETVVETETVVKSSKKKNKKKKKTEKTVRKGA
ncbi:hypothetical protein V7S43_004565 [Phytophthora oleae]|uniref:Uncharacterized protein n=1 Tax=Phytophthora oleae TaxID=2107226 RepID=A0ABD3FWB5_9STRA